MAQSGTNRGFYQIYNAAFMAASPTVLVAPLHWGLGHATRCIPIIDELLAQGADVVLGSDGAALALLQDHYPHLPAVELPTYGIRYPTRYMGYNMAVQLPRIQRTIQLERKKTATIVQEYGIDALISDNRYGVHHPECPSVFVTHQLHLRLSPPFFQRMVNGLLHRRLRVFDACWVPDWETAPQLSGNLGHPAIAQPPTTYVGPLSRLQHLPEQSTCWDIVAVLSGPEPQRQYLEDALVEQLQTHPIRALVVSGRPADTTRRQLGPQLYQQDFMAQAELQQTLAESHLLVARSGYTTVLDCAAMGRSCVLWVPTPGQTEQEYLAERLVAQGIGMRQAQKDLNVWAAWAALKSPVDPWEPPISEGGGLATAIRKLLASV